MITDEKAIPSKQIHIDPAKVKILQKGENASICYNARQTFSPETIESLARNIAINGLLNRPGVRLLNGNYWLIYGERRWRSMEILRRDNVLCVEKETGLRVPAKKLYGLDDGGKGVPVQLYENIDDKTAARLAIAENIDTEKLADYELILYCLDLEDQRDAQGNKVHSRKEIAEILNKSEPWVSQTCGIGKLPKRARQMLADNLIGRTGIVDLLRCKPEKIDFVLDKLNAEIRARGEAFFDILTADIEELQGQVEGLALQAEMADESGDQELVAEAVEKQEAIKKRLEATIDKKRNAKPRISQRRINEIIDGSGTAKGKARPLSSKTVRERRDEIKDMVASGKSLHYEEAEINPIHMRLILETMNYVLGARGTFDELLRAAYDDGIIPDDPEE